mmetsp:Transcript_8811/g.25275  ORF Transcript_8811/g.25275 Transcript_8811/m.25275 type:complete len:212 (-) Transcript_8811:2347-2982(-)
MPTRRPRWRAATPRQLRQSGGDRSRMALAVLHRRASAASPTRSSRSCPASRPETAHPKKWSRVGGAPVTSARTPPSMRGGSPPISTSSGPSWSATWAGIPSARRCPRKTPGLRRARSLTTLAPLANGGCGASPAASTNRVACPRCGGRLPMPSSSRGCRRGTRTTHAPRARTRGATTIWETSGRTPRRCAWPRRGRRWRREPDTWPTTATP